jgi:hypothetical protein
MEFKKKSENKHKKLPKKSFFLCYAPREKKTFSEIFRQKRENNEKFCVFQTVFR